MKKLILKPHHLFSLLFISMLSIASCKKSSVPSSPTNTINTSSIGDPSINFVHDEDFTVYSELGNWLDYEELVILAGTYSVDFSTNGYGKVELDIDDVNSIRTQHKSTKSTAISGHAGINIRIAKRVQEKKNGQCTCCGGIGFRCGLVSNITTQAGMGYTQADYDSDPPADERVYFATVQADYTNNKLIIEFEDDVDWTALDD